MRCKIVNYSRLHAYGFCETLGASPERFFFHASAVADSDEFCNLVPGQIVEGYDPVLIEGRSLRVLTKMETKLNAKQD